MNKPLAQLIKLSGLPAQYFYFKKKIYCLNNNKSLRKIKGPAIIVCNHTSVYDYMLMLYVFYKRNIRVLVGETMYTHSKFLNLLINIMGGIKVDRKNYDFSFLSTASKYLNKKQVLLIFPESRLPTNKDPKGLLPFAPSYVYLALKNNVPIIPVYTNGIYGKKKKQYKNRAKVLIGDWIYPNKLLNKSLSNRDNINNTNKYIKDYIVQLGLKLENLK